jgi:hypothetical protein
MDFLWILIPTNQLKINKKMYWHTPVISELGRLRQASLGCVVSLGPAWPPYETLSQKSKRKHFFKHNQKIFGIVDA